MNDVGSEMAKSAQNAARSVNENRRQEVNSTTSMRTTTATTDVSVSTIENVNQGRTLNLMFYRLYNRFAAMLYLDELSLRVRSGTELVAGTGLRPVRTYSFHELDQVIDELATTPIPVVDDDGTHFTRFKLRILERIAQLVRVEYLQYSRSQPVAELVKPDHETDDEAAVEGALDTIVATVQGLVGDQDANDPSDDYGRNLADLERLLGPLDFGSIPVVPSEILVAAKGLYLDSHVGSRPSTEPYSERMRQAETEMRQAEIERVRSETLRNTAIANHVARSGLGAAAPEILDASSNGDELTVVLSRPLGAGRWQVHHGDQSFGELTRPDQDSVTIVHRFAEPPQWLSGGLSRLQLVNPATGERVDWDPSAGGDPVA